MTTRRESSTRSVDEILSTLQTVNVVRCLLPLEAVERYLPISGRLR